MAQAKSKDQKSTSALGEQASTMLNNPSLYVQNLMGEPLFYEWCHGAFWAFLGDESDLESKVKALINVTDFADLEVNTKALETFKLFLDRPYCNWLEKCAAAAHSVYPRPVPYVDERQLKIDVINAGINEQMEQMVMR